MLICLLVNEQGVRGGSAPLKGAALTKDELLKQGDSNFGDSERRLCDKGMQDNHDQRLEVICNVSAKYARLLLRNINGGRLKR